MTPIITPAPKKKRLSGIERLQIDIPSADVKKEQRRRREEHSHEVAEHIDNGLPTSPYRTNLLCVPIACREGNNGEDKTDRNSIMFDLLDDSDDLSQSSDSHVSSDMSQWDDDGPTGDTENDSGIKQHLNRIIDFNALKTMIELKCTCRRCSGSVILTEITVGIATTVVMTCTNCEENSRRTETGPVQVDGHDICHRQGIRKKPPFIKNNIKRFIDFPIHYSLVLLMQQLGCGLEGIRAVLSHLSITDTIGDWDKWRLIMDAVGSAQQQIADECMLNNIKEEIKLSQSAGRPMEHDPAGLLRQGLTVSIDMGWQKRSSGNIYDSPSGVSLMIGALSKTILQRHVCGKLCSVCVPSQTENNKDPKDVSTKLHRNIKRNGSISGCTVRSWIIPCNDRL